MVFWGSVVDMTSTGTHQFSSSSMMVCFGLFVYSVIWLQATWWQLDATVFCGKWEVYCVCFAFHFQNFPAYLQHSSQNLSFLMFFWHYLNKYVHLKHVLWLFLWPSLFCSWEHCMYVQGKACYFLLNLGFIFITEQIFWLFFINILQYKQRWSLCEGLCYQISVLVGWIKYVA